MLWNIITISNNRITWIYIYIYDFKIVFMWCKAKLFRNNYNMMIFCIINMYYYYHHLFIIHVVSKQLYKIKIKIMLSWFTGILFWFSFFLIISLSLSLSLYIYIYIYIYIFILRCRWMLESDWLMNVLRCVIILRETHGERSSRQLSWPHYSSVSLRQIIPISKVL